MYRWKTKAVLLGLTISDVSGNPLIPKSRLSLSSAHRVHEENDDGFNDGKAAFDWLSQCAGAEFDTETCLVSKTLDALIYMDSPSQDDDATFPTRRRFLQEQGEEGGCLPDLSENDLRYLMNGSRAECNQVSIEYTDQYFEEVLSEFLKVLSNENCWNELCSSPEILMKLMFDHAMQCANVDLDVNQCIKDQIMSMMLGEYEDDDDYYGGGYDDDYYGGGGHDDGMTTYNPNHRHRALRSLQDVMTDCVEVNEFELAFFASFMLMEVEGRCNALGVSLTPEDISKASDDLVTLFSSTHCFGDAHACDHGNDDGNDDEYDGGTVVAPDQGEGQLDHFAIGIKYVEQCANIELDLDSCLTRKTLDFFKSWGSSPSMHRSLQYEESDEGGCMVPEIDETLLNALAFDAKQQCIAATGTPISDEEYNSSVEAMYEFVNAQNCWLSLCEEGENPSRMLLEITFEEIGICAQADLDAIDPCLLNQIFDLIFNVGESSDEGGIGDLRRKLQRSLSNQDVPEPSDDPCEDQPSDAELYFIVNLLLAGASESCPNVSGSQVSKAETELFKLFGAQSCWVEMSGCEHNDEPSSPKEASYLEFVENKSIDMLAQCAEITDATSCVFWRSLETLRFMGNGQAENSNGPLLQHAFQEAVSNICIPPSVTDDDIKELTYHALDYCSYSGLPVESHHVSQALADLKKLIAKPDCFEDLCTVEIKEMIVEEWLSDCASLDTRYLTRPTNYSSDYSSQPLDNDTLHCMTKYLVQTQTQAGSEDQWECSLPHISPNFVCGEDPTNPSDIMKEAYIYCSGEEKSHPPSPSPDMSMSFVYHEGDLSDLDNWSDMYETYFSYSMSYNWQGVGQSSGNHHEHEEDNTSAMLPYVLEVCHLLGDLDSDQSRECLKPVCDYGIEGALSFEDSDDMFGPEWDTAQTDSPTMMPTVQPTSQPSLKPTSQPSSKPTKKPTKQPTPSPTVLERGVVEVKFEVAMTLSGINTSDIDITSLDSVVSLLEGVIGDMLPEGATARLLKVGGFSLTRRMLQEDSSIGVDVEFEVIFSEVCLDDECEDSKETLLKEADVLSSDIVAKVEDGSLSASIQEKAAEQEIEVLKSITVSPSSLKVSAPSATVTIKKTQEEEVPDDDSAGPIQALSQGAAMIAVAAAMLM